MKSLQKFWQRIMTTRYARALEAFARLECALREEVARERAENLRLRAENRALLNSILGIAGVPPLPVIVAPPAAVTELRPPAGAPAAAAPPIARTSPGARSSPSIPSAIAGAAIGADVAPPASQSAVKPGAANVAVPMRRRSWQQINRMLEFESTKKKEPNVPT